MLLSQILRPPHGDRDPIGLKPFYQIRSQFWRCVLVALTGLIYVALGVFTFRVLDLPGPQAFAIFPPVGFGVAMVALFGTDALLGVVLGAIGLALWLNVSWVIVLWSGWRAGLEAWLFAYLLQVIQVDIRLRRLRDVLGLVILATPLSVALNALLASTNGLLMGNLTWAGAPQNWWTLVIADMVSILMLTPFLILTGVELLSAKRSQWWAMLQRFWQTSPHRWESGLWVVFMLFLTFRTPQTHIGQFLVESLPFLSLAWAAARFGVVTTVCASFWINSVQISHVIHGQATRMSGDTSQTLLILQTFIAVMVLMSLGLAAVTEEREALMQEILQEQKFDRITLDIVHRLVNSLDIQEIMQIGVRSIYEALKVDRVYLLQVLLDGSSLVTTEVCRADLMSCLGETQPAPVVVQLTEWYRQNGIQVMDDIRTNRTLDPLTRKFCEQYQVQARVAIPVLVDGRGYGLLSVHQCDHPRSWTAQEVRFLETVVTPLGAALHHGILYQQERNLVVELDQQVQMRTAELQRSLVAQERLNEGQTRLLHAVSHDLRTPIIGSLLVLRQMQKRDPIIASSVIKQLEASSERQLCLIQALLEDYRAEDGTLRFKFQTIDYGELIQQTLRTLSPILTQNQAQVKLDLAPDLPPVQADPTHLQRVLENLITNALKHNPPGLTLRLAAAVGPADDPNYLRCAVADDGVGIPAEVANQLFLRPYLRSTQDSCRTGLGLGLYLSHQIIMAHGGQLKVEPTDGKGVRFGFTLPIAQVPSDVSLPPPSQGRSTTVST